MIVVFTGAGVSAESGLGTFRDSDGLWEHYRVEDVCTHEAWLRNPELCVKFYNDRRRDTLNAQPNAAHIAIAKLQQAFPDTRIITQNIDDLHERAGAKNVVHLHGEITKLRSERDELATVPLKGWEQHYGDRHPDGSLLRPYIVFFGEGVPYFDEACRIAKCLSGGFAAALHPTGNTYLFRGSRPAGVRCMGRQDHPYQEESHGGSAGACGQAS